MTCRDSVYFHAFVGSPTVRKQVLTARPVDRSKGAPVIVKLRKLRYFEGTKPAYKWCKSVEFELPAAKATYGEAMLVAREKELGMERPSQIRNKKFAGELGKSLVATDLECYDVPGL